MNWRRFDANNDATWPEWDAECLVWFKDIESWQEAQFVDGHFFVRGCAVSDVTHYCIPIPPGEQDAVSVPRELTAENGAKAALLGEFSTASTQHCPECDGDGCEDCSGQGYFQYEVLIDWTNIKAIFRAAIKHFEGKGSNE
jgi:hypothetical protein